MSRVVLKDLLLLAEEEIEYMGNMGRHSVVVREIRVSFS